MEGGSCILERLSGNELIVLRLYVEAKGAVAAGKLTRAASDRILKG
jgi:hypothetical protein